METRKIINLTTEISSDKLVKQANEGVEIARLVLLKFYYMEEDVVGYDELNQRIVNYLCNTIGSEEFQKIKMT